jgi:uncharacterized membrane protein (GlpM family)
MTQLFWFGLALKILLTAGIVVTASVAVERSGPFVGAMIAALPTAAAAAYIILALEHDAEFLARSAVGSLVANAATCVFACTYVILSRHRGVLLSLGVAILAWLVCALATRAVNWTIVSAALLNAVVFAATILATASVRRSVGASKKPDRRAYDLVWRAVIVTSFVVVVTTASHRIGAFASGLFAVFPIAMSSFAYILHTRLGGDVAGRVLAHALIPLIGFAAGFVVLHAVVAAVGVWWGLLAHLATCLVWTALVWAWRARRG